MTASTSDDLMVKRVRQLERRLADLEDERERRPIAAACARCYAVVAGIVVVLCFFPILGDDVVDDGYGSKTTYTFGSIWEMASQGHEGNPAGLAAFLMVVLVLMLLVAVFRRGPGVGGLDGAIAGLAALMLVTKPGTGDADPPLAEAGQAALAILILTAVLGITHETYAFVQRRRGREATRR